MKTKTNLISLLAVVMLLSGCNTSDIPENLQNSTSSNLEISDPMQNSSESSQGEEIPSMSYGVKFTEENIEISNGKLVAKPVLMGDDESTRVGIMVFVDGILQEYTMENSDEKNSMSIFEIAPNSKVEHKLSIDAEIDGNLDEHFISVITMVAPDYVPPEGTFQFGFYHNILRPFSVKLPNEIESISSKSSGKILKTENSVLTKNQTEWLNLSEDESGGYKTGLELLQSDDLYESKYTKNDADEPFKLKLYSYTTKPVVNDYRITFFVNHQPVKFNGDYDYLDVKVEGQKITVADIEFDGVKEGDFIYCIASPLCEGEQTAKSSSKIIMQESGGSDAVTSNDNSSVGDGDSMQVSENILPAFSIGDYVYAKNYDTLELVKLNSAGDVVKTLENGYVSAVCGDKIQVFNSNILKKENGKVTSVENPSVTLKLLDADFNVIKSLDITENIGRNYSFNEQRIAYVCSNENGQNELRVCDWNYENEKVLMTLPDGENNYAQYFDEIAITDNYVAFTAQGEINNKSVEYYGICDMEGNHQLFRKDGISKEVQVVSNTSLWYDKNVNVAGGQVPSGEIIMYKNGKFDKVKLENPVESQDVFLTGENEFFTALIDGDVLRQYKNGVKTAEIPLDKGEQVNSVTRSENKIFAGTKADGKYNLKIWELN